MGQTSPRREKAPSRPHPRPAMWYLSSWRNLPRRSNAGHGLRNKPEITPPSHSNHRRDGTRGITHKDKGDLDRALADFNAAIRLSPTDPDAYFGRGSVHERTRDYEAALVDYETALKINSRHANALKGSDRVRAVLQKGIGRDQQHPQAEGARDTERQ